MSESPATEEERNVGLAGQIYFGLGLDICNSMLINVIPYYRGSLFDKYPLMPAWGGGGRGGGSHL